MSKVIAAIVFIAITVTLLSTGFLGSSDSIKASLDDMSESSISALEAIENQI